MTAHRRGGRAPRKGGAGFYNEAMEALAAGLALGFTAGISPGPLLALVLSSTLERGFGAGVRVAIAPALTDGPIIAIALLVLKDLPAAWLSGITILGGVFLIWIGVQTVRSARGEIRFDEEAGGGLRDLGRGMLVNVLNPHPWLFWLSVGGPILIAAWRDAPIRAIGFLATFYCLIVGSKILFAWLTARGRRFLSGAWYRRLLVASGLLLIGLGGLLVWQATGA